MKISDTIDPHVLPSIKLKAFWVLDRLEKSGNDRFTAGAMSTFLIEKYTIKTSRQAIEYALKQDRHATHKNNSGYKLMESGRKQLKELKQKEEVVMIEAGKPFSAKNIALKDIFSALKGETLICDPYVDINTLDIVFKNSDKKKPVKILTKNVIDKPAGTFTRHLTDLRNEGYKVEIGVYSSSDLHDRYIMDNQAFWLSGNSLNHLGSKESFLVRLGEDIRQSMLATFNNRWKVSKKL